MNKIIVTSYPNPDLDGTACAMAYAELLNKQGQRADYQLFGHVQREVEFAFKYLKIKPRTAKYNLANNKIILVDVSNIKDIPKQVNPKKVIEVIDHRQVHTAKLFKNAKIQLELVGSCATLIAEKFIKNKIPISRQSAVLLYGAIASNTINFKSLKTEKDIKAAKWLQQIAKLPKKFITGMFVFKSRFTKPLITVLKEDLKEVDFDKINVGIAQLEIVKAREFFNKNLDKIIRALKEIKKNKKLDLLFLNCIDIEKAYNLILTIDIETQTILTKILNLKFKNNLAKTNKIIMRKHTIALLKNHFANKK